MAGPDEEVGGDDRGADITGEGGLTPPRAAAQAEDALEERDDTFDSGSEVSEFLEEPGLRDHVLDLETALLGENHVLDAQGLGGVEIILAGIATVHGSLAWVASVLVVLALKHADEKSGVGWVALLDDPVEDETADAARQRDLEPVVGVAAVLTDDVRMRLEDLDELLAGWNTLRVEDAATGLRNDLHAQGDVVLEFAGHTLGDSGHRTRYLV